MVNARQSTFIKQKAACFSPAFPHSTGTAQHLPFLKAVRYFLRAQSKRMHYPPPNSDLSYASTFATSPAFLHSTSCIANPMGTLGFKSQIQAKQDQTPVCCSRLLRRRRAPSCIHCACRERRVGMGEEDPKHQPAPLRDSADAVTRGTSMTL